MSKYEQLMLAINGLERATSVCTLEECNELLDILIYIFSRLDDCMSGDEQDYISTRLDDARLLIDRRNDGEVESEES